MVHPTALKRIVQCGLCCLYAKMCAMCESAKCWAVRLVCHRLKGCSVRAAISMHLSSVLDECVISLKIAVLCHAVGRELTARHQEGQDHQHQARRGHGELEMTSYRYSHDMFSLLYCACLTWMQTNQSQDRGMHSIQGKAKIYCGAQQTSFGTRFSPPTFCLPRGVIMARMFAVAKAGAGLARLSCHTAAGRVCGTAAEAQGLSASTSRLG